MAAWRTRCPSERAARSNSSSSGGRRLHQHRPHQLAGLLCALRVRRLHNELKVKDRELEATRRELTTLRSSVNSHERCVHLRVQPSAAATEHALLPLTTCRRRNMPPPPSQAAPAAQRRRRPAQGACPQGGGVSVASGSGATLCKQRRRRRAAHASSLCMLPSSATAAATACVLQDRCRSCQGAVAAQDRQGVVQQCC